MDFYRIQIGHRASIFAVRLGARGQNLPSQRPRRLRQKSAHAGMEEYFDRAKRNGAEMVVKKGIFGSVPGARISPGADKAIALGEKRGRRQSFKMA